VQSAKAIQLNKGESHDQLLAVIKNSPVGS